MTTPSYWSLALASVVGLLSGTHTSIWGMYKDAAHEGFATRTFARSIVVGIVAAIAIQFVLQLRLPAPSAIAILFGLAYAVERGLVEVWKTFIRVEDQSKYFIPMQFSLGGRPVESRFARLVAGAAYVAVVGLALAAISRVDGARMWMPLETRAALAGLVVGTIIAIGGCWKDAPKEGFDLVKFFRSPLLTTTYAVLLAQFTGDTLQIAAAAIGYERASAETYKTFFFPSKPRGKFAGKPILHPEMLRRRNWFVPIYAAICGAAVTCIAIAL